MIRLAVRHILLLPLLLPLVLIALCWIYYRLREPSRLFDSQRERIYRCQVCDHVYVDDRDVPLSRCPRCDTLNEPVRS